MRDIFRPHREPAMSIYDAFQKEAGNRKGREVSEWVKAEREAVWQAARDQAGMLGLRCPTLAEVESAERYAMGSVDYGAKWAYQVANAMNLPEPPKEDSHE